MTNEQLDDWWCSRPVSEKVHIASKVYHDTVRENFASYVWNLLSIEQKQEIYDHCKSSHNMHENVEREGKPMSY